MAATLERGAEVATLQRRCSSLVRHNLDGASVPAVHRIEDEMKSGERGSELVDQLCVELKNAETQLDTYTKLFEELRTNREALEDLSSRQQEEMLQYADSKQKALFERCCGMKFKLTEDQAVSVQFEHVSAVQPDLTCSITLDINSQEQWEVVEVTPPLSDVHCLLEELNRTKNLGHFCKDIRTRFKLLLQQQQH